jgi:hypothetical protein
MSERLRTLAIIALVMVAAYLILTAHPTPLAPSLMPMLEEQAS